MKAPATTNIAVSKNAIDTADSAEAGKYAPAELSSARDNLGKANKAMSDEKYQEANDFAIKAQSDAKVATSKANATKAQQAMPKIWCNRFIPFSLSVGGKFVF